MPTMKKVEYTGEIIWLGKVSASQDSLRSVPVEQLNLAFDGVSGERHEGTLRPSCVRMTNLYPEGTQIRNVRQLSILSAEELDAIASEIGLEALDPRHLGVSIVVQGIPDFTHVPPASRLQGPSGVTVTTDTENRPCAYPAKEIEANEPGHGKGFLAAAKNRRGVTAWVERPGILAVGDMMSLFVPDQRSWSP